MEPEITKDGKFKFECTHGFTHWAYCPTCNANLAHMVPGLLREIRVIKEEAKRRKAKR